jgi:aspartate racemase
MNDRIIGIIGGMGPEATADIYMKIIKRTKAKKDQDHFHVIIDSNTKVPDRTQGILYGGEDPLPYIQATAKRLDQVGVDIGAIPCLTSHYFHQAINESVTYPILNAIEETGYYIKKLFPKIGSIGVLATSGTIDMLLFNKYLPSYHIIYPSKEVQEKKVMEAIYGDHGIKSGVTKGKPLHFLVEASNHLIGHGAELIIFGCTEIGLSLKQQHLDVPGIDPLNVLADILTQEKEGV